MSVSDQATLSESAAMMIYSLALQCCRREAGYLYLHDILRGVVDVTGRPCRGSRTQSLKCLLLHLSLRPQGASLPT